MYRLPGIIFGFLAIVFLVLIVWSRRDEAPVDIVAPELAAPATAEAPADAAAAPAAEAPAGAAGAPAAATPAPAATAGAPAAEAPAATTAPATPAATPAPAPAAEATPAPGAVTVTAAVQPQDEIPRGPGLGAPATPEQLAALAISIAPDGRNLPPGSGTSAQGALVYIEHCVGCHGPQGAGGDGMIALTGGVGSLATPRPVKTVASFWPYATTVFDYIRRAMPLNAPQSLTDDEVYAVVAFLLSVDDILPIGTVLNAETLPQVEMPNRNGFVSWWPPPETATPG